MKQNSGISGQLAVGLIIFSMLISACSSVSNESANSNTVSRTSETEDVAYKTAPMSSNSAAMNSSGTMATPMMEAKRADGNFDAETSGERYARIDENPFLETSRAPLSTFSIDVDTASYANVRRYFND